LIEEAELAAGEREDHRVLRRLFHKLGVVIPARLGAVAAGHEEKVADRLALDRVDHRARHVHHGVAGESDHHRLAFDVRGKSGQGQRLLNDRFEIGIGNVPDAGPADQAAGKNVVFVGIPRFLNAVGRHQNGAGKFGEFPGLILPGRAVVAVEMGIFFQRRIAVGGQHFTVRVNGDALAFGLLEQLFEVLQVMAGNQDGLALLHAQRNLRRNGMAERRRIARVEQFHRAQIDFAAFQDQTDPAVQIQGFPGDGRERLLNKGVNLVVFLPQNLGVVRVSCNALDAEKQNVLKRPDIRVFLRARFQRGHGCLGRKRVGGRLRRKGNAGRFFIDCGAGFFGFVRKRVAQGGRFADQFHEAFRIEIHVGQRRKKRLDGKNIHLRIDNSRLARVRCHDRQAFERVNQQVLEGRYACVLSANARFHTPLAFCRLFALVTKHR